MAASVRDVEADRDKYDQHTRPLLDQGPGNPDRGSLTQKAFKGTAHLANLLPTGTVLAFQLLSPIFTNQGHCDTFYHYLTGTLLALCGLSCIILCFTDSFVDEHGIVRYIFATCKGLWVIDGSPPPPPSVASTYRINVADFLHAFMSLLVFGAVTLLDPHVVSCLYPTVPIYTEEFLKSLPIAIGFICSMMFASFPTVRHGIGFPIAPH